MYMFLTTSKVGVFPDITCQLPFIEITLPLYAIFMLVGVDTKHDIIKHVFCDAASTQDCLLLSSILDCSERIYHSREEVIDWIGREGTRESTQKKRMRYLTHILTNEMLPHLGLNGSEEVTKLKALFLGRMVRRILRTYTNPQTHTCDDRDDYANKRIDSSGMLMSLLFRQLFRNFMKTFQSQLARLIDSDKLENTNVGDIINHRKISSGFKYAFSTGNWGMQKGRSTQSGVAQIMSRTTLLSSIANMRRINTPINREGKAPKPRMLHPTSWGIVCPAETPEGSSCGLVKNLAMMAHVRVGTPSSFLLHHLDFDSVISKMLYGLWEEHEGAVTPVLVNGVFHSYVRHGKEYELCSELRKQRRNGLLPFDITIVYADSEVAIDSDAGCLCRPLLLVERLPALAETFRGGDADSLWDRCVDAGIIEFLDKSEESHAHVAVNVSDLSNPGGSRYTHIEIDPSLINGVCASLIPFSNHNQAPRNTYQSAMCKQAVGVYALNFQRRMDTVAHVLCYPQRPIVSTRIDDIIGTQRLPSGNNPIVCIMCYTGFNQEDSLIVNEQALERGMFRSLVYRTSKDEERNAGADAEKFERPDPATCFGIRAANYDKLAKDGIVLPGTSVQTGDAVIGKTIYTSDLSESRKVVKRDKSVILKNEDAVVDAVLRSCNKEGHRYVKIRTRAFRQPIVGDKLSCARPQADICMHTRTRHLPVHSF